MGNIFSGSEIVELGIQIEKNGRDFYSGLSGKSQNSHAAGIFKYLAGEEEKHIVVFQKILASVEKYEPAEAYPGEYFSYMNALAVGYIFTQKDKGKEIAAQVASDVQAVELGIGFEKDSIIFYEGMKKAVPEYDLKIVDALIAQEQNHFRQLMDLQAKLK